MAIEQIELELIHDNPFQARLTYHRQDIEELAHSIKTHGLLQVPPGRRKDGNVELGFGHLRKRAFAKLAKKEPEKWGKMPIDIRDLSDEQMAIFALEENLKREGLTPLETARAVDHYLDSFPGKTEVELAESLNMSKGTVSNMRRVLRLPEKILEKIDEGIISFHQGRDLLTLEGIPDAEALMSSALTGINTTGNKSYSQPNTVEGLQKSIHSTINGHFPPLEKEWGGYRYDLLFDTRTAGCLKCDKCLITHPTKSQAAHYCTDEECWKQKTGEHKAKAAVAAKAKMEAEILERVAKEVAQRTPEPDIPQYILEKRGTSWIALNDQGRIIAESHDKEVAEDTALSSTNPVTTKVNPGTDEYLLNHTYRVIPKPEHRSKDYISDVTAQDMLTAIRTLGISIENVESVKVWKSSGKLGTGGSVSAGWSKCTELLEDLSREEDVLEGQADDRDRQMEEFREKANMERPVGELPCDTCLKGETCERKYFHISDEGERYICDVWELLPTAVPTAVPTRQATIPDEILNQARAAAGTRAEVMDINDISTDHGYSRQMKPGNTILDDEFRLLDNPEECLEHCTQGFHFAFDSKAKTPELFHVCTNTSCLGKKKSALTRKKNAAGLARKNAERKAIQEAIAGAPLRPRGLLLLVFYAQVKGQHISNYFYGNQKAPEKWLWDKVSAGTAEKDRTIDLLINKLDKMDENEHRRLLVDMMFFYLADSGDTGSYTIKTEIPLKLMGVEIELEPEKEAVGAASDGDKEHA